MRALIVTMLLGVVACGPPIAVKRVSGPRAYRSITANALSTDHASEWTRSTVNEWGLLEAFEEQPEAALAGLREVLTSGRGGQRERFALAELSFLHAEQSRERAYHLATAVYAYAFLFPERPEDIPDPFDPRARIATDLYNRAITTAFASRDGRQVELAAGVFPLPFGELKVSMNQADFDWGDRHLEDLLPVAEFEVEGMRNRHRLPGLGAALSARAMPREGADVQRSLIAPRARVAATAFLRIADVHAGINSGQLTAAVELYTADAADTVVVGGRPVPLEIDETTTLAVMLAGSPIWKHELWGFFGRSPFAKDQLPILASLEPYRPGRIPVVFVHGTESSPARWADMVNDLLADPWIRRTYQFWLFTYDSGNPIAYTGMLLRDRLVDAVTRRDPAGADACLRQMVVVGHSQGGLLTKLTAVDTGDDLWNAVSRVPLDEMRGSEKFRELLRRALFVKPLPFVRRLIFVATPHRGSFLTGGVINTVLRKLIRLPTSVASLATDALINGPDTFYQNRFVGGLPTAIDNMTPGNPFLEGFARIPVAPGVPYHSIVAVEPEFPSIELGNDGVVEYRSAHLEGAASELVVRSSHSTQSNPHTVQEVRRILHLHGAELAAEGMRCGEPRR